MEFNKKLQELRKNRGLTQEELAEALFVSRTAVSKWESGRGYPNLQSLKAISVFFGVTVDGLLSGDELLTIAEDDAGKKESNFRNLVFGLLDCGFLLFLFLPLFGQETDGVIQSVPLFSLTEIGLWLKIVYSALVIGTIITGIVTLILQNRISTFSAQNKNWLSLPFNVAAAFVFIISRQPYAAAFAFVFLIIKVFLMIKKH